jgi:alanyl-tRNA synthetase
MTIKLYDQDSHLQSFRARVISCHPLNGQYQIILDQTAFFPGGGGQAADTGFLNQIPVINMSEHDQTIIHCTDTPIQVGTEVLGVIDWDQRFRRMQHHSGEHLVSGLVNQLYGYDNVGFHMGNNVVTMDYNGSLTPEDLKRIEYLANEAVVKNVPVTARYPRPEELATMNYRSKLDLTENVRIVSVEGYDTCACCAPHVSLTGEIGPIKLLDCTPHRGGVRITMVCGFAALEDYVQKFEQVISISRLLSAKQDEVYLAVLKLQDQLGEANQKLAIMSQKLVQAKMEGITQTEENLLLFEPELDSVALREMVNIGMLRCGGICAAFSGEEGFYRYVIGSQRVNLQAMTKEMNQALHGKGGGTASMIHGSAQCTRAEIEAYFYSSPQ